MKRILIINGHPDKESFCFELAKRYKKGAGSSGADCKLVNLIDLNFSPLLKYGYRKRTELEPDLKNIQNDILDADHLVFVYPTWWGTQPALLKGFIERVFLPGFAYKHRKDSVFWDKLLTGKSARLIVTMDTPKWYYNFVYKKPGHNSMKKGVLNFCGVKPVKITTLTPVKSSNKEKREKWLKQVEKIGQRLN
jgi:putative NADPH-quinone reductase